MWRTCLVLVVMVWSAAAGSDTAVPQPGGVVCETVADCWLDEEGRPIKRPRKFRGKALPRGDCGNRIQWLRNRLSCEQNRCVVLHVGDRC